MQSNLTNQQIEFVAPVIAIVFGLLGVALPAIGFSMVRKVISEHETMAGIMLVCVTVICVVGLAVGGVVILALIGWLPSPAELFGN